MVVERGSENGFGRRQIEIGVGMEAEFFGVVGGAVEEVEAVSVEGEEDAGAEEFGVLGFGNVDGVALEFAGEAAEFGGVEGFAELLAEGAAFFTVGDEDGFGIVVDEFEVAGGGLELEVEEVLG